jgi:hypothetical protein
MPLPIVETQLKRFDADSADREAVVKDLRKNSESMGVWSGSACVFEACHKFNGVLASVENFTHVVLQLKDYNGNAAPSADSAALVEVIVEAADFDTTVDDASAADFSKAHFKFALTDEQMAQTDTKWLLCFARTISGNTVTLRAGTLVFTQDGGPSVTAPDPVASSAWTKGEADARFLQTANNLSEIADAGSAAQAAARTNLGILASRVVTWDGTFTMAGLPGDRDPVATLAGQPGLALYTGDGTTHGWLFLAGINAA